MPSTRAIVANKIAGYPTAPAAVRHRLLKELISLKAPEPANAETRPLAGSGPAPADELSELFFASSAEERRLILLNLPYAPLAPAEPIAPAIARESTHRLEAAALGHNSELFARELERILAISRAQARRLYEDEFGRADRGGRRGARHAGDGAAADPAVPQSDDQPIGAAGVRSGPAARRDRARCGAAADRDLAGEPPGRKNRRHAQTAAHQPQYWQDEKSERRAGPLPVTRPKVAWDEFIQARKAESA